MTTCGLHASDFHKEAHLIQETAFLVVHTVKCKNFWASSVEAAESREKEYMLSQTSATLSSLKQECNVSQLKSNEEVSLDLAPEKALPFPGAPVVCVK